MNKYLLRLEGVNLSAVLDDTAQISIRRGASFMLREATLVINESIECLKPISIGASVGLYEFAADNEQSAEEIQSSVATTLNDSYQHMTFVVDIEKLSNNFQVAHENLITKNRYRQLQQMTLVAPIVTDANGYCEYNKLHPVDTDKKSKSCISRLKSGIDNRQNFYNKELDENNSYDFTDNLNELSKPSDGLDFANLNHKMAVIYLDGNSFGKIQQRCQNPEDLRNFDTANQNYRKKFLKELLEKYSQDSNMKNGNKIRIETLLWGGDEMILVVPAWKGFEVIQFFYECSKDWKYNKSPLTYAGGLVFCNHKTPIQQVIKLAYNLAETAKEVSKRAYASFEYLVLESVDYPTQSLDEYWALRYGNTVKTHVAPLMPYQGSWVDELVSLRQKLNKLPKGVLYDIALTWVKKYRENNKSNTELDEKIARLKQIDENYYQLCNEIFSLLQLEDCKGCEYKNSGWLHLIELWDYLAPINTKQGK